MINQSYQGSFYQYSRCECHECTQARWKMYGGGGLEQMQEGKSAQGQALPQPTGQLGQHFAKEFGQIK